MRERQRYANPLEYKPSSYSPPNPKIAVDQISILSVDRDSEDSDDFTPAQISKYTSSIATIAYKSISMISAALAIIKRYRLIIVVLLCLIALGRTGVYLVTHPTAYWCFYVDSWFLEQDDFSFSGQPTTDNNVSIPTALYFTYKNKLNDDYDGHWIALKENMYKMASLNPTFTMKYFDDEQCAKYIESKLGTEMAYYFNHERHGPWKADLFRVIVLYFEGGYYLDVDIDMRLPIDEFISTSTTFTSVVDSTDINIFQAFLGSTPTHPILGISIELFYAYYRGSLKGEKYQFNDNLGTNIVRMAMLKYYAFPQKKHIRESLESIARNERDVQLFYECSIKLPNCPGYHWNHTLSEKREFIVWDMLESEDLKKNAIVPFYSRFQNMRKVHQHYEQTRMQNMWRTVFG